MVIADTTLTRVLDDLAAHPASSTTAVSDRLRCPYVTVAGLLLRLERSGRVRRVRSARSSGPWWWEVTPRG